MDDFGGVGFGGLCGGASFVKADGYRDDRGRRDYRERYDERRGNANVAVDVRDLPRPVFDAVACEARGRAVESAQFVRNQGNEYFRVRIDNRGGDQTMLVATDGRVINPDEQTYRGEYRRDEHGHWVQCR